MTTKEAALRYEMEHRLAMSGKRYAVYNPQDKPLDELPLVYGFNNGGSPGLLHAVLIAEDGTELGDHACSSEGYMLHDLGILEGTRPDRHKTFRKHYPDGYQMEFVSYKSVTNHEGLQSAFALHNKEDRGEHAQG